MFEQVPGTPEETYAAQFALGRAHLELGEVDTAREHLSRAIDGTTIGAVEQWFEAASLLTVLGESVGRKCVPLRALSHPTSSDSHRTCSSRMLGSARHRWPTCVRSGTQTMGAVHRLASASNVQLGVTGWTCER